MRKLPRMKGIRQMINVPVEKLAEKIPKNIRAAIPSRVIKIPPTSSHFQATKTRITRTNQGRAFGLFPFFMQ